MERKRKIKKNKNWILIVVLLAFVISIVMGFFGELILSNVGLTLSIIITLVFIFLGIVFDIIGVSFTAADIHIFNSMASKKVKGAHLAVRMISNASRVSSVCCDVVGDVCGVASGSSGVTIAAILILKLHVNAIIVSSVTTAIISVLTIGGKAMGKEFAIKKSAFIVEKVCKFLALVVKE